MCYNITRGPCSPSYLTSGAFSELAFLFCVHVPSVEMMFELLGHRDGATDSAAQAGVVRHSVPRESED